MPVFHARISECDPAAIAFRYCYKKPITPSVSRSSVPCYLVQPPRVIAIECQ
jgi:hypothetical protein